MTGFVEELKERCRSNGFPVGIRRESDLSNVYQLVVRGSKVAVDKAETCCHDLAQEKFKQGNKAGTAATAKTTKATSDSRDSSKSTCSGAASRGVKKRGSNYDHLLKI